MALPLRFEGPVPNASANGFSVAPETHRERLDS
jgi:hypothetical protein